MMLTPLGSAPEISVHDEKRMVDEDRIEACHDDLMSLYASAPWTTSLASSLSLGWCTMTTRKVPPQARQQRASFLH